MLKFESTNLEDFEKEAKLKATELSTELIEGICNALDANADAVTFDFLPYTDVKLSINKPNYIEILTINFPRIEDAEKYELCKRASDWMNKLKK